MPSSKLPMLCGLYDDYYPEEALPMSNRCKDLKLQRLLDCEKLVKDNLPAEVGQCQISSTNSCIFVYPELTLRIEPSTCQPDLPIQHAIENRDLPRKTVDSLRKLLRNIVHEYQINILSSPSDFVMLVLLLLEETTCCIREHKSSTQGMSCEITPKQQSIYREPDMVPDTAYTWLGKTTKEICQEIMHDYRIVHVETIMRNDLSRRFKETQDRIRTSLLSRKLETLMANIPKENRRKKSGKALQIQEACSYLVTPRMTFHGTRPEVVVSIVQYGFLKPGDIYPATNEPLGIRCGNTYGRGIYTSPNPSFSLLYSTHTAAKTKPKEIPGLKLLVCATIMGRVAQIFREDDWREMSEPYPGTDSHICNEGNEYIVFNSGQVLPCYVLHLDWKNQDDPSMFLHQQLRIARNKKPHPKSAQEVLYPGDKERLKQERIAQASKFFAYGFGPISGKNIVVEEVGEVSDDEEDNGD